MADEAKFPTGCLATSTMPKKRRPKLCDHVGNVVVSHDDSSAYCGACGEPMNHP